MKKAKEELNSFFFCVAEKDRPTPYSQELMGGAYSTVFAFPSPFSFRAPAPLLVIHTQRDIDIDIDTDICTYIYDGTAETSHKPKKKGNARQRNKDSFLRRSAKTKTNKQKKKTHIHTSTHLELFCRHLKPLSLCSLIRRPLRIHVLSIISVPFSRSLQKKKKKDKNFVDLFLVVADITDQLDRSRHRYQSPPR